MDFTTIGGLLGIIDYYGGYNLGWRQPGRTFCTSLRNFIDNGGAIAASIVTSPMKLVKHAKSYC